ncbi:unnamed protein product, partial [Larinioides sclopetarius]
FAPFASEKQSQLIHQELPSSIDGCLFSDNQEASQDSTRVKTGDTNGIKAQPIDLELPSLSDDRIEDVEEISNDRQRMPRLIWLSELKGGSTRHGKSTRSNNPSRHEETDDDAVIPSDSDEDVTADNDDVIIPFDSDIEDASEESLMYLQHVYKLHKSCIPSRFFHSKPAHR